MVRMETEIYSISFYGLDPQYYTNEMIGNIWNKAAIRVYQETGIIITGEVHDRYYVRPDIGELNGSTIFMIESRKDPHEVATVQDYWNAYREVVEEARSQLGNPGMSLTEEKVIITYFEKILN